MIAVLLAMLGASPADVPRADAGTPPLVPRAAPSSGTSCAACHTTSSWTQVAFNHDRTGFPLSGAHRGAGCRSCHETSFSAPLPRSCAGCHRDVHASELGSRCESCHETTDWQSRFDADAHRRSAMPLLGSHAALPCIDCHGEARERRFSRAAPDCGGCHEADAVGTAGGPVDHPALGFTTRTCRGCHRTFRFTPALFPGHEQCFPIRGGAHAGIACLDCHATLGLATAAATCSTGTATCSRCHEHRCERSDEQHRGVAGYQCRDVRCYECHQPQGAR